MKINPISNNNIINNYRTDVRPIQPTQKSAGKRDEVIISDEAREFSLIRGLEEQVKDNSSRSLADFAKIESIKRRVRDGSYNVSAAALAEKLLGIADE